ncbi:uncharacterized protein LOC132789706 isoform X11 [Drosophila nasuta]|uniref:Uncharacterized protein LOC117570307 isoform X9 n=1 Tax=Drosophila albomicans TaxID=7291 RepID=A0A6P8X8W8_DROAB|nr:uncharacterized protein LOC117570307 isoform X9 [Drosophila albomicans]XP_060653897.1 uncharacterized protein LOC132789706 isoform X11 [Drosophila nasuta]
MEVGAAFYFILLLIIGFLAYIVLQCLIIWIIRCCCPAPHAPTARRRQYRQNNIELGRQNNRYGDIFFIEPNSQEAARIREQLEKDEKDLPSYDEVMRMCNLTTPTAAAAASPSVPTSPVVETGPIGIVALPAPPYSETDPNPSSIVVSPSALESAPSTSRAAQIPA